MKFATAVALYFLIVFGVGFLVGPVRVLYVEPRVGATVAVMLETPALLVAMLVGARLATRWSGVARDGATLLAVGFAALVLQQIADIGVGIALRGVTITGYFDQFATAPGMIYGALLIVFVAMPFLTCRLRASA